MIALVPRSATFIVRAWPGTQGGGLNVNAAAVPGESQMGSWSTSNMKIFHESDQRSMVGAASSYTVLGACRL